MAKTTAPALSFSARGSIAKTMVYSTWRGVSYARQHVIPANPQTVSQQANRTLFSTMTEMWKVAPLLVQAPWNSFATGRPFTGRNKFIGENVRVLGGEALFTNFIGSPGSRGGLTPDDVSAIAGASEGEIDVTFTTPTPPSGWTLDSVIAMAFPDQDPTVGFGGPIVAEENDTTKDTVTLTGLGSGTSCIVAGWLRWIKPDGSIAYSVGVTDTVAAGS